MAFTFDQVEWAHIVVRIQAGDQAAMQRLYETLRKFTRYHIWQQIGNGTDEGDSTDDCLHDIFLVTVQAIREGRLRDPRRLMGFVQGVSRFKVAHIIKQRVGRRKRHKGLGEALHLAAPEAACDEDGKSGIVQRALAKLSEKDRRILIAFYLEEKPWQKICAEMNLTPTQFRLGKSRALARFGKFGKAELAAKEKKVIAINDRRKAIPAIRELQKLAA